MGVVNNLIDTVAGTGGSTNLEGFLSKLSDPQGRKVYVPDPHSTFDVKMTFFPCSGAAKENGVVGKLLDLAKSAVSNAVNNVTGGLAASINSLFNDSVEKQHDSYSNKGKYSFLNYLAVATMLDSGNQGLVDSLVGGGSGSPSDMLELDLTYFVQNITVPQLRTTDVEKQVTFLGEFNVPGQCLIPDNNEVMFNIINTTMPLMEFVFYPWMREVTLPYWSYDSVPYTTATITIDFSKHMDVQYVFCGCRPKNIQTIQPNQQQDGSALIRQVSFAFDYMYVESKKLQPMPSPLDKALELGKSLAGGAASMLNM